MIDNTAYHSMTADEKTAMYNYYKSVDSNGDPQWIIPEAEIDENICTETYILYF